MGFVGPAPSPVEVVMAIVASGSRGRLPCKCFFEDEEEEDDEEDLHESVFINTHLWLNQKALRRLPRRNQRIDIAGLRSL